MASKDWKLKYKDKEYIEWLNKDEFKWIGINKIGKLYHVGGNRINEKDFKTKSQALKYAKAYMKTH